MCVKPRKLCRTALNLTHMLTCEEICLKFLHMWAYEWDLRQFYKIFLVLHTWAYVWRASRLVHKIQYTQLTLSQTYHPQTNHVNYSLHNLKTVSWGLLGPWKTWMADIIIILGFAREGAFIDPIQNQNNAKAKSSWYRWPLGSKKTLNVKCVIVFYRGDRKVKGCHFSNNIHISVINFVS